jgi:hypothetical protein
VEVLPKDGPKPPVVEVLKDGPKPDVLGPPEVLEM